MRTLSVIAFVVLGIGAAAAADLPPVPIERPVILHHVPYGARTGALVIYDFEPGVVVRAYWLPPWRHRHYFPFGVDRSAEVKRVSDAPPQPAESFYRSWSTCDMCEHELPPLRARDEAEPDELPPPAKKRDRP